MLSHNSYKEKQKLQSKYYSHQQNPSETASPLRQIDHNQEPLRTSMKTSYGMSNKIGKSGDSKNFTNSISFKNFQGSDKTSSSRCKMSLGKINKLKQEKNMNELNEFMAHNIQKETYQAGVDKSQRKIGFTKKELNSLLQMQFLKKKNKTLK